MQASPAAGSHPPRLNPFAFPSDTDFRFMLLIAAVLATTVFIYSAFFTAIPSLFRPWQEAALRCNDLSPAAGAGTPGGTQAALAQFSARLPAYNECVSRANRPVGLWMMGGLLLVLGLAAIHYRVYPRWKLRREGLERLSADDAPEVVDYLASLCREIGLDPAPTFVWDPLDPAMRAQAFGCLGRYYVALAGGLVTQFYTDRPAFRAILLHELAHLRNADVDKTYFAVAIWRSFIVVALLPLAMALPFLPVGGLTNAFSLAGRLGMIVLLVTLTRNAVLRSREVYADLRASVWEGAGGAIARVLARLPAPRGPRWRALWDFHPDPQARRRILYDTRSLFGVPLWVVFATGFTAALAQPNVDMLAEFLWRGTPSLVSILVVSGLVAAITGVIVWRATDAALAEGKVPRGAGTLSLVLAGGLVLGRAAALDTSRSITDVTHVGLEHVGAYVVFAILLSLILLTGLFVSIQWMTAAAWAWLEAALPARSPRLAYTIGSIAAGAVLTVWLSLVHQWYNHGWVFLLALPDLRQALGGLLILARLQLLPLLVDARMTLFLTCLWLYPLAAWFWRGGLRRAGPSRWLTLDPPTSALLPRQSSLRPFLALIIGVLGGLAFTAFQVVFRLAVRLNLFGLLHQADLVKLVTGLGFVAVAALLETLVAVIVAVWVSRTGQVHGLFAASVAGIVGAIGVPVFDAVFGGTVSLASLPGVIALYINPGCLLALLAASAASALADGVRRLPLAGPI